MRGRTLGWTLESEVMLVMSDSGVALAYRAKQASKQAITNSS
jgi:hypothetical protein